MQRVRLGVVRGYGADVMTRGISKIAMLAALVAALCAGPARAGTYDVTTCSPSGPGGTNHAWTAGTVMRLDSKPPAPNDIASYDITGSCAGGGITVRSGTATTVAT